MQCQCFRSIAVSLIAIGLNCGCTTKSNQQDTSVAPYLPNEQLAAPKTAPLFLVAAPGEPTIEPFYIDWSAARGSIKVPPSVMHWSAIAQKSTTLGWLETSQIPIRVVIYVYPQVSPTGIPPENSGFEHRCLHSSSQQSFCTYRKIVHSNKSAIELTVRDKLGPDACYVVVHGAWIVQDSQAVPYNEVSASWGWSRCPR
uniref:Uncharacterized protein n=1 Tax=Tolypothrix bouteillei VB521301 TaxID=1479485 RepID=A0A0C1R3B4_9CYAN